MQRPNVISLLHEGMRLQEEEKATHEAEKIGTLRGGSSGCLVRTDDGVRSVGGCARKALLRMLGIEVPDDEDMTSKQWMFSAGVLNEDGWANWLERAWQGHLLREEDIPTRWATRNGTPVTGRPDIVLADKEGQPQLGLELKQASSIWTVRDVLQDKPKTAHVCQAAHYSMALGVPFELHYVSRVNYHVMGAHIPWVQRHFPRYGERHSDKCDYKLDDGQPAVPAKQYKNGKVKEARSAKPPSLQIFRVLPFVHGFRLDWREGTIWATPVDLDPEKHAQPTVVTEEGIQEYYETAAMAVETDVLPPEPAMLDVFGNVAKFRDCQYCPLQNICAQAGETTTTRQWLHAVNEFSKEQKEA